jgi:hypothetical protein
MLSRNLSTLFGAILHAPAHFFELALKRSGPVLQGLRALFCRRLIAESPTASVAESAAPAGTALAGKPGSCACSGKARPSAAACACTLSLWSCSISSRHTMPPFTNS